LTEIPLSWQWFVMELIMCDITVYRLACEEMTTAELRSEENENFLLLNDSTEV
jgi:phage gp36-like protein